MFEDFMPLLTTFVILIKNAEVDATIFVCFCGIQFIELVVWEFFFRRVSVFIVWLLIVFSNSHSFFFSHLFHSFFSKPFTDSQNSSLLSNCTSRQGHRFIQFQLSQPRQSDHFQSSRVHWQRKICNTQRNYERCWMHGDWIKKIGFRCWYVHRSDFERCSWCHR